MRPGMYAVKIHFYYHLGVCQLTFPFLSKSVSASTSSRDFLRRTRTPPQLPQRPSSSYGSNIGKRPLTWRTPALSTWIRRGVLSSPAHGTTGQTPTWSLD